MLKSSGRLDGIDQTGKMLHVVAKDHGRIVRVWPRTELGERLFGGFEGPFDCASEYPISIHAGSPTPVSQQGLHRRIINEITSSKRLYQQIGVRISPGDLQGVT